LKAVFCAKIKHLFYKLNIHSGTYECFIKQLTSKFNCISALYYASGM